MAEHGNDNDRASGENPIKTEWTSIRLTIVDLMAALIPGLAWLLVLAAFWHLGDHDPLAMALTALHLPPKNAMELLPDVLAAFIVGYAVKPVAMTLAGRLSFERFFVRREAQTMGADVGDPKGFGFPYAAIYRGRGYYKTIVARLEQQLEAGGEFRVEDLPRYPPFSVCKRMVRILRPELWEELEHREAETRMAASLFLAASASVAVSFAAVILALSNIARWQWFLASLIAAVLLSIGFRISRRREVEYVYLGYLIASR